MTAWPSTLPSDPLLDGYSQQQMDNSIRSKMDYGPDKLRRRTTGVIRNVHMKFRLTKTQLQALDEFYNVTLAVTGIIDWVDHRHPDRPAAQYRFLEPPSVAPIAPDLWEASLALEMLP